MAAEMKVMDAVRDTQSNIPINCLFQSSDNYKHNKLHR